MDLVAGHRVVLGLAQLLFHGRLFLGRHRLLKGVLLGRLRRRFLGRLALLFLRRGGRGEIEQALDAEIALQYGCPLGLLGQIVIRNMVLARREAIQVHQHIVALIEFQRNGQMHFNANAAAPLLRHQLVFLLDAQLDLVRIGKIDIRNLGIGGIVQVSMALAQLDVLAGQIDLQHIAEIVHLQLRAGIGIVVAHLLAQVDLRHARQGLLRSKALCPLSRKRAGRAQQAYQNHRQQFLHSKLSPSRILRPTTTNLPLRWRARSQVVSVMNSSPNSRSISVS